MPRFEVMVPSHDEEAGIAVVRVDGDTGGVRLERFIAVDDCGRILNPMLVAGHSVALICVKGLKPSKV